jgi:excisionase family DNA binding protein
MKHRSTQFGPRKNPDSERAHGLRLAVNSSSRTDTQTHDSQVGKSSPPVPSTSKQQYLSPEDSTNGATRVETREQGQLLTVEEIADLLRVPVSWVYGHTRKRSHEKIPGYRVGKYWRFDANEVMSWLREEGRRFVQDRSV